MCINLLVNVILDLFEIVLMKGAYQGLLRNFYGLLLLAVFLLPVFRLQFQAYQMPKNTGLFCPSALNNPPP